MPLTGESLWHGARLVLTSTPLSSRSNVVCSTHTWASIPSSSTCADQGMVSRGSAIAKQPRPAFPPAFLSAARCVCAAVILVLPMHVAHAAGPTCFTCAMFWAMWASTSGVIMENSVFSKMRWWLVPGGGGGEPAGGKAGGRTYAG